MFRKLREIWNRYSNEKNVLVYQFGKVGSSALEVSLDGSIHIHALYGNFPCHVYSQQVRKNEKIIIARLGDLIKRIAIFRRKEIRIVTIVREPVSRNVSMFFQDLSHWVYHYVGAGNIDTRSSKVGYLENVFYESFDHEYVQKWFDDEFKRLTGIDIRRESFSMDRGYEIISKGKFKVLFLKYENLSVLKVAINEFLRLDVDIQENNVGDSKWYGSVYKEFKNDFKPKEGYLDRMFNLPYVRAFYKEEEIKNIRRAYEKK